MKKTDANPSYFISETKMNNISRLTDSSIQPGYEDLELYYDHTEKKLYAGIKGIARWVGCHQQTIDNTSSKLKLGKTLECLTSQGIRMVKLISSREVVSILGDLSQGNRTAKATKQSASDKLTKLAEIGFELTGLLAIAPDEVAKTAIRQIKSKDKLESVKETTNVQERYLDTYHALHDEIRDHDGTKQTHLAVNKYNTETLKKKPLGYRTNWEEKEKNVMIVIQQTQTARIKKHNPTGHDEIVQNCSHVADLLQDAVLRALE